MIGILLVLLGFNSVAMLILPALAGVFADNPSLHTAFSTVAITSILFEFVLPFLLIGAWFGRRDTPAVPRYRAEPVGDYPGLNEVMTRHELEQVGRRLDACEINLLQSILWNCKQGPAAAALASDRQVVGKDMRLAAARVITEINGERVESNGDGTWYLPGRKLHVEADGTTWKEV